MFLLTFGRCGKAEWRRNAATDALVDMVRKLTFGRWGDIAGKMHTFGRWEKLYPPRPSTGGWRRSWGEPRFPLWCWWQYKKKTAAGCCGRWFLGVSFERKTGFELALISLTSGSKSARVFRALLYPPRPSTGGWRRSWGEPHFPLGCGRRYKKRPRWSAAVGGSVGTLLSGKRGSNPRPSAWEADALPTELFPRKIFTFAWFGTAKI